MPIMDDRFQNVLTAQVIMSGANTLTFAQMTTGASLGMQLGLIIDEIRYFPTDAALREIVAATDSLVMAVTTSDQVTDLADESDSRILHSMKLVGVAAVGGNAVELPLKDIFNPPLILASPNVYLAAFSAGFGAAGTVRIRISFRFIKLSAQEYLEIAETFLHG